MAGDNWQDETKFGRFLERHAGLLTATALFVGLGVEAASNQTEAVLRTVLLGLGMLCLYELGRSAGAQGDSVLDAFQAGIWIAALAAFGLWVPDVIRYTPQALGVPIFIILLVVGELVRANVARHLPMRIRTSEVLRNVWISVLLVIPIIASVVGTVATLTASR